MYRGSLNHVASQEIGAWESGRHEWLFHSAARLGSMKRGQPESRYNQNAPATGKAAGWTDLRPRVHL